MLFFFPHCIFLPRFEDPSITSAEHQDPFVCVCVLKEGKTVLAKVLISFLAHVLQERTNASNRSSQNDVNVTLRFVCYDVESTYKKSVSDRKTKLLVSSSDCLKTSLKYLTRTQKDSWVRIGNKEIDRCFVCQQQAKTIR